MEIMAALVVPVWTVADNLNRLYFYVTVIRSLWSEMFMGNIFRKCQDRWTCLK